MQAEVALCVHMFPPAVSYPGVGRFRRAETGILGVEQQGARVGPLYFCPQLVSYCTDSSSMKFPVCPKNARRAPAMADALLC